MLGGIGQQLGKNVIPILEKYAELRPLLMHGKALGFCPSFGVRVKVSATGSGKWAASGGDSSKFGISISPHHIPFLQSWGCAWQCCEVNSRVRIISIERQSSHENAVVRSAAGARRLQIAGAGTPSSRPPAFSSALVSGKARGALW
jgi:hypothetical protein